MSYLRAFSQRPAKTSAVHSLVDALSSSLYVALYAGLSKEREEKRIPRNIVKYSGFWREKTFTLKGLKIRYTVQIEAPSKYNQS
jgi:hypothetical protein